MPNYKLTIQYDGTDFFGWQSQPSGNTVQDKITEAISKICNRNVKLIGSGRTDSGVHAWGQVANFIIDKEIEICQFKHSLNSVLPSTILISNMEEVSDDFHARFNAKQRSYFYLISKTNNPFFQRYSYHYPEYKYLNMVKLKEFSNKLIGTKDFTSFCKSKSDTENKVCSVSDVSWKEKKDLIYFKIEADRFLHGMVRTIVGTLLFLSKKNYAISKIDEIIEEKNRTSAFESVPARGLYLYKVKY